MGIDKAIDVTQNQKKTILDLLSTYLPNTTVWVYGSRIKWTARPSSDLDMVAFVDEKHNSQFYDLREAFEESDLPFRVDLFNWNDVPDQFRKNIKGEHFVLQEKKGSDLLKSGWKEVCLTDAYNISSGLSKPAKYFGSGFPFLSFKDVFHNFFIPEKLTQLVESSKKERLNCSILRGDVFLTRTSETMHELGMSSVALKDYDNATFNGFTKRLRPNNRVEIYPEYIGYYLRSPQFRNELLAFSTMSTRASLNNEMISKLKLILPSINKQRSIAWILKSLDDKIELNQQINKTLEAMAQALFKSWFVDFDPVIDNALAAGKPIPEPLQARAAIRQQQAADKQQQDIRKQFPSEFEFSEEMGWIPLGWKEGAYAKFAILNQKSWTKKNAPSHVRYIDLSNTKNGRINASSLYGYLDAPSRARRILNVDDTIIGTVRPGNRSFAFIQQSGLTGSTGFAVLTPIKKNYRSFIYLGLTQKKVIENFAHLADGAAYPAIKPDIVVNTEAILPNDEVLDFFDLAVYPWLKKIGQNEKQNGILAKLRNTLLPKLLSGELRIPDAEKLIQKAIK